MPLTVGSRLGPYEIVEFIGAGGMGEVYRARDARLGRDVAIKTLPTAFADNADRLRRFELEARAASLLTHPGILTIYDIGSAEGQPYIVSELLEGETLRQRLSRGAIPLRKSVEIAAAVADALAAAHGRGIVHRDLKPENLLLTRDGRVKILDFGIAKLTAPDPEQQGGADTVVIVTDAGIAVGTLGYMAPEQLRGEPTDPRSDLFALGAILHEMVSGAPAFKRDSRIATVNAVLEADPPDLDDTVPLGIRRIVRRCVEKDPDHRFQSARDLAFALGALSDTTAPIPRAVQFAGWPRIDSRLAILGVVLAAAGASALGWMSRGERESAPLPVRRFSYQPTLSIATPIELSSDGRTLAYVAGPSNQPRLHLRQMDQLGTTRIPGTEYARMPFFSPDGEWVAFTAVDKLKKVPVSGGPAITLADVSAMLEGAWGPDGQIIVALREQGLMMVSAEGGPLVPLTTPDRQAGEIDHHAPAFLPGGRAILYTVHTGPELFRIAVRSLDTGDERVVIDDGYFARFVPSGHLIFGRTGGLFAVPFDPRRLQVTGAPVQVIESVLTIPSDGQAIFSIASDGTLVYAPARPIEGRTLVWVDRSGREEPLPLPPRGYAYPALSPDGKRLAVQISEGPTTNVWLHDLASGALQPLTRGESDTRPVWTTSGTALTYASRQPDGRHIILQPLEAGAIPRSLVVRHNDVWPGAWTHDNRLLFVEDPPTSISNILQWQEAMPAQPEPLLAGTRMIPHTPTVSPDGRWLTYTVLQQGIRQVVVRAMTGSTPRQITADGGVQPRWTRNGAEIVFRHSGRFMSVPIRTAASFDAGRPQELFADTYISELWGPPGYDVTADGARFLVVKPAEGERTPPPLHFVEHWFSELRRRVPSGR